MKNNRNTQTSDWSAFHAYMRDISSFTKLTEEQEIEAGIKACQGDIPSRDLLVQSHLRLVASLATKYTGYGLPVADLVAEGNLALIRAAELYNPKFGTRFSTYATMWINQRLQRALTSGATAVRIPQWRAQRLRKLARMSAELSGELGREVTTAEMAERLGITEDELDAMNSDRCRVLSMHAPVGGEDEEMEFGHTFADENAVDPNDAASAQEEREMLLASLHGLDDRELQVLALNHGLEGKSALSLREIGKRFGVSHEWARRLALEAMKKVRRSLKWLPDLSADEKASRRAEVIERIHKIAAA